VRWRG